MASRTHYLNADFDLGLRPRPSSLDDARLARHVRELSAQALIGAGSDDAALLRIPVPSGFLDYVERCGTGTSRILVHPEIDRRSSLRPFGWDAEAIELNARHDAPAPHPALECVTRVNSRSFALELERELGCADPRCVVLEETAALERFLTRGDPSSEWIVKSEHGNSGLANRRLRGAGLTETDRRFVDGLLEEDDRVVVEPWYDRQRDWCVVFDVPLAGQGPRIHETTCTRDGALIGALFAHDTDDRWRDDLARTAERVAARLEREGYFGPACIDAFSWRDGERVRLRPLVDLNCRRPMSDGAFRVWRRLVPERCLFYRFFNRRKLALPAQIARAVDALGDLRYDPGRRAGVLFASPPGFSKVATILVAGDRDGIRTLEREFRARFEGRRCR